MRMKRQSGRKMASAELHFLPFAAKRITRSSLTQKTNRSPFKELSIDIKIINIPSIFHQKNVSVTWCQTMKTADSGVSESSGGREDDKRRPNLGHGHKGGGFCLRNQLKPMEKIRYDVRGQATGRRQRHQTQTVSLPLALQSDDNRNKIHWPTLQHLQSTNSICYTVTEFYGGKV